MTDLSQYQDFELDYDARGNLTIRLVGNWSIYGMRSPIKDFYSLMDASGSSGNIIVDASGVGRWDSGLLAFLGKVRQYCEEKELKYEFKNLPEGALKILELSRIHQADHKVELSGPKRGSFFAGLGRFGVSFFRGAGEWTVFLGRVFNGTVRLVRGKSDFRFCDFVLQLQEAGAEALPIVSLISILVGLTMAFVGAMQLEKFGAQIYVADLVALGMVREMGAVMAAVILCGRTGAAYAATLGSMKVTEELDALKVSGISVVDFLVMPRMLALFLMMPLLCVFADLIGILGGVVVAVFIMDLSLTEYINETRDAITLTHLFTGIIKSTIFGILIAITGCLRGMQCASSAASVGRAATSAVVSGITAIVIADAFFAVLFNAMDI